MSMLQKERWIYDPKRGLARDTKDPQQSDQPLRNFVMGKKQDVAVEDDATVTGKKKRRSGVKKTRSKKEEAKKKIALEAEVVEDIPPPTKKQKKGRQPVDLTAADVFDANDTFDPPIPGRKPPRTGQPQKIQPESSISHDDINLMLDAKLEKILAVIASNQSSLERSFQKALDEQKKAIDEQKREFAASQKAPNGPPHPSVLNYASSAVSPLQFSPSTTSIPAGALSNVTAITYVINNQYIHRISSWNKSI